MWAAYWTKIYSYTRQCQSYEQSYELYFIFLHVVLREKALHYQYSVDISHGTRCMHMWIISCNQSISRPHYIYAYSLSNGQQWLDAAFQLCWRRFDVAAPQNRSMVWAPESSRRSLVPRRRLHGYRPSDWCRPCVAVVVWRVTYTHTPAHNLLILSATTPTLL